MVYLDMGFTYNSNTNTIISDSKKGLQIQDLYTLNKSIEGLENPYKDKDWKTGFIIARDSGREKTYRVWIAMDEEEYYFLIKPYEPYNDAIFESIFNFGNHCSGWYEETILGIKKEQIGNVIFN